MNILSVVVLFSTIITIRAKVNLNSGTGKVTNACFIRHGKVIKGSVVGTTHYSGVPRGSRAPS